MRLYMLTAVFGFTAALVAQAATQSVQPTQPCYVQLFDDDNFDDENDLVYGPGKWGNMRNLPGAKEANWEGEADSLKVGPTAMVKVWNRTQFQGESETYGPGTEKPNLDFDIHSMEITCK